MNNIETFHEKNYIFIIKAFAIISVVMAHVSTVSQDTNVFNKFSELILNSLGSIGVGTFLLISGYLFCYNNKTFFNFMKSKITSIIILTITIIHTYNTKTSIIYYLNTPPI